MNQFINNLSQTTVYNYKLAITRSLLAFGTLLTILFNTISKVTNVDLVINDTDVLVHNKYADMSIFSLVADPYAKMLCILILLLVISGIYPRIVSVLHFWVSYSVFNSFIIAEGGDQITSDICLLLLPICVLDNRRNHWQKDTAVHEKINIFNSIAFIAIQVQVAVVYLHAAVGKLFVDDWQNGTAAYYWITNSFIGANSFMLCIMKPLLMSKWVVLFTWGTIVLELLLFACIFATPKVKYPFLIIGILFHFFILLLHGLVTFFCAMSAALILYLDDNNRFSDQIIFLTTKIKNTWRKGIHYLSIA